MLQCPSCQSDNVTRLEVLYQQGMTQETHQTKQFQQRGHHRHVTGQGETTVVAQSELSKKAAPPEKAQWGIYLLIPLVGMLFGAIPIAGIVLWLGTVALAIWLIRKVMRHNKEVWPGQMAKWQKSWMCNRCGAVFEKELMAAE